jgi:hypothetical protein
MSVGVVRGESDVGVPLRRLFRYEWMDVMIVQMSGRRSAPATPCSQKGTYDQ